jgi:uncharacterized protein YbjT (DUF2867 family)
MEEIKRKTVTLLGATGLIGSQLLDLLEKDDAIEKIFVPLRREMDFPHKKIEMAIINFADKKALCQMISQSDAVFCAVGTTMKKVKGDKAAYRKIDYEIPVNAAQCCNEGACSHFLLVSSVGADSRSKNFYLKLKGETEDMIQSLGLSSVSIFRPSMLLGKRKEFRLAEVIAQLIMTPFSLLIPQKYRPVQANIVALAMVRYLQKSAKGIKILHYQDLIETM